MPYKEYPVHPRLKPYIRCYWTLSVPLSVSSAKGQSVLAEGLEWVFNLADPIEMVADVAGCTTVCRSFFSGPMTQPMRVRPTGRLNLFGVCFRPGGALPFLSSPVGEIVNRCIQTDDLWEAETLDITNLMQSDGHTTRQRIDCTNHLFLQSIDGVQQMDARTALAVDVIEGHGGQVNVHRLAAWVGLSHRQLERLFKMQVGLSPKQLCRSLRFKSVFQQLALSPISTWAATAQSCGYYDQPHMIRDFKHFTGHSPASFFKNSNEVDGFFIGNFHNQPKS
jgi:AraC-like DNA-binding protein